MLFRVFERLDHGCLVGGARWMQGAFCLGKRLGFRPDMRSIEWMGDGLDVGE